MNRPRRQPERSCVSCGAKRPKRQLYRVVRSPAGVVAFDPVGKAPGRGAYLCGEDECLKRALPRLAHALDIAVAEEVMADVRTQITARRDSAVHGRAGAQGGPAGSGS